MQPRTDLGIRLRSHLAEETTTSVSFKSLGFNLGCLPSDRHSS